MEAFTSLKFWPDAGDIVDVRNRAPESYDGDHEDDSFFELVFTAPESEGEKRVDRMLADELEKRDVAKVEKSSPFKAKAVGSNCKPQSPIDLLKSAPKFRVLLLGFRKSKPQKTAPVNEALAATQKHQLHKSPESVRSKRFAMECEVEEVQIASLFSRDNSLRSKLQRERASDFPSDQASQKSPKDVPTYLRLIKPFYVRASKRYSKSCRLSSDLSSTDLPWSSPASAATSSPRKLSEEKRGNRGSAFRVLSKRLGKSHSASAAVRITPSSASRRDDSLLLQHDGIQSAILYCKRSLYSNSAQEFSGLWRPESDPTTGKPAIQASNSSGEQMRCTSI